MSSADLTAEARIRSCAVGLFGRQGIRATTIRDVAQAAGVSPALVIHHFGSKDGLRQACDEWVLAQIVEEKSSAIDGDLNAGVSSAMGRLSTFTGLAEYIGASLTEGGPGADALFDQICEVTGAMLTDGVLPVQPMADPDATVAAVVAYTTGAAILGSQIARRLGGTGLYDPEVYSRYGLAALELFTHGLLADDSILQAMKASIASALIADPDPPAQQPPSDTHPTP